MSNHQTITTVQRGTGPPMLDIDRAERIATAFFKGGITGGATTRDGVLARIIAGHYLGLNETASVMGVMVNGGKPAVWGDVLLAKIRASGELADYREEISGEGDALTATVTVTRVGHEHSPTVRSFSVADAKKAGLWTKAGPWQQYTRRMLPTKPRAWALRDTFADVLMGISIREEYEPPEGVPVAVALAAMKALPQLVTPTPALPAATVATPADPEGPITSATLGQVAYARTEWLKATEIDPADGIAVARERQPEPSPPPLPPLALPTAAVANLDGKVSEATLQEIAAARADWLVAVEIDPADTEAVAREWGGMMFAFGCKSARELSENDARNLLVVLKKRTVEAGQFIAGKLDTETQAAALFGGEPEPSPTSTDAAAGDAA